MAKKTPIDRNAFAKTFFSNIVSTLALDEDKTQGRGVEFDFLPFGTLLLHYAGTGNKAYVKALRQLAETPGFQSMPEADQTALFAKLYADTIVVGLLTPDKEVVPYDDDAKRMCAEAFVKLPNIFSKVQQAATDEANFRVERDKANTKNS